MAQVRIPERGCCADPSHVKQENLQEKVGKCMEAALFRALNYQQMPDWEKSIVEFLRELKIFASELQFGKHWDICEQAYDVLHGL